ncbi:nucleotidyltransferase family protein [Roseofilum sp. BLCC_M154]|uniref:Nucleotidyltransferase family protein n=1 Tax=Roseofilum acuticapitatum BLCC-M154 TaxID=3022444 RepID=A0ABT7AY68_9CYAN|nr:nucleotidyltransferase family protein [Roseofilum acuticapitatum]MDJ1171852.1 nucleotidyltransferase family protein [Roseofilum acuticapitatum BLCC-M154]
MRLEHQLILKCARTYHSGENQDKIVGLLSRDLDWNYIFDWINYHGLIPLFYWTIKEFQEQVNPNFFALIHGEFKKNACRNLSLTQELIKIIQCFETAKIPVVAFKGPVLAQTVYQNLGFRQFVDLDILIPPDCVSKASKLLIEQGYEPQFEFQGWQENRYTQIRPEHNFYSSEKDLSIDLHWSLISSALSFHENPQLIWEDKNYQDRVKLGNKKILTLSPEALLLFLCVHGAKHDWSHLSWVCDIAELLHRYQDLDWLWIEQQVGHLGTQTMLELGLGLAQTYLEAPVPEDWVKRLESNSKIQELGKLVEGQWFNSPSEGNSLRLMGQIYVQTMDSPRDRLWYWFDYVATPTPLEWEILPLPSGLFFFYYPLRLFRLLWKYCPSWLKPQSLLGSTGNNN